MKQQLQATFATIIVLLLAMGNAIGQTASFSASSLSGCAPLSVNFTDNSTGTITAYSWNLGNGGSSTLQSPSATYSTPGIYTVTLTVTGPGGTDTETNLITVYDKPVVSFASASQAGCPDFSTQFSAIITANSPGTPSYSWDFGDGNSGSAASLPHTYTSPGLYSVSLTVTNGAGCPNTDLKANYINVYSPPVAAFSGTPLSFCSVPASTTMTNTSFNGLTPYTTAWNFGDGGTGSGSPAAHTYNAGGAYGVTMIVTDAHTCSDTTYYAAYVTVFSGAASFTGPTSICFGDVASFANTTFGTTTDPSHWDFGDGDTSFSIAGAHNYRSPGIYTVTMTTYPGSCVKTTTRSITVNALPLISLSLSPFVTCPAPASITFNGSSPNAASYTFKNGNGVVVATGPTYTRNYTSNTRDTISLIVTNTAGCKDSVWTDTIEIRKINVRLSPEDVVRPFVGGCVPFTVNFSARLYSVSNEDQSELPYPYPGTKWFWDFGDGTVDSSQFPAHTFPKLGNDTVRCIVQTANGCQDTGYRIIHVDSPVHPSFFLSPTTACPGDTIVFHNTNLTPLTDVIYYWETDDTLPVLKPNLIVAKTNKDSITHVYHYAFVHDMRMVTDNQGCLDTLTKYAYLTIEPPGAKFKDSIYCPPSLTVQFINQSSASTGQLWRFGDGDTSTAFSPVHNYRSSGAYTVTLFAFNSSFHCTDSTKDYIQVYPKNIDFKLNDPAICLNDYVEFTQNFKGNDPLLYEWIIEGVTYGFDPSGAKDFQYTTYGFHDVTMIVSSGIGCYDTLTRKNVVLVSQPVASFSASPPIGCQPLTVAFTDNSTNDPAVPAAQRRWWFGDGDTAINNQSITNHIYYFKGDYTVTFKITDSLGCADSMRKVFYISVRHPSAVFHAAKDSVCRNTPAAFNSISTGKGPITHYWDFGDNTAGTGAQPTHAYADTGWFMVRLIVRDTIGCADTIIHPIYVSAPFAGFTQDHDLAICPPLPVQFTDTSHGSVAWLWNFDNGSGPVTIQNPIHTFSTPGLYHVYQVAINSKGCTDTARSVVRVLGYNGAFSYTPIEGCAPMAVNFAPPATGIPKITWDFFDGNIAVTNGSGTSHTYLAPGKYLPRVIFSDGKSCASPSIGLDTIYVDQLTAGFKWSTPCVDTAFSLIDTSTAIFRGPDAWSWIFENGDTASAPSPSYTFHKTGNHSVTLIATNITGCRDTVTRQIFVNALPDVAASPDKGLCPGDSARLWATGANNYVWSPTSLVSCVNCDTTIVHTPPGSSWFYVTGTDANGCINRDSARVYLQFKTTDTTGNGGGVCVGQSFRLFASGADHYLWSPAASLDSPASPTPIATPHQTTTYLLIAQEGTCGVDSVLVTVAVHSLPVFSAGNDQTIGRGSAVTLHPTTQGIDHITWLPDSTLSCLDCFSPIAYPLHTRTYYATGYDDNGCFVSDSVTVFVRCNGDLVFVPNTFSPNGDGNNDFFFPRGDGVDLMSSFRVFNRWGEIVFERNNVPLNDEHSGWDGTFRGKTLPPDVYVYTMESRCEDGKVVLWKGDITLMR